jgi:hypothetical protein
MLCEFCNINSYVLPNSCALAQQLLATLTMAMSRESPYLYQNMDLNSLSQGMLPKTTNPPDTAPVGYHAPLYYGSQ